MQTVRITLLYYSKHTGIYAVSHNIGKNIHIRYCVNISLLCTFLDSFMFPGSGVFEVFYAETTEMVEWVERLIAPPRGI